jgi:hypothetical protein
MKKGHFVAMTSLRYQSMMSCFGKMKRAHKNHRDWLKVIESSFCPNVVFTCTNLKPTHLSHLSEIKHIKVVKPIKTVKSIKNDYRSTARVDEDARVKWIVGEMNNPMSEIGKSLRTSYTAKFGNDIDRVEKFGANKDHYDLLVYHTDGTCRKCEEKGTRLVCDISETELPWKNSVQCFNGVGSKFHISRKYTRHWYTINIQSGLLSRELCIESVVPSFEEWSADAYRCGNPKTPFGIELKNKVRHLYGGKASLNGKCGGIDFRNCYESFEFTDIDKKYTIYEVRNKLSEILNEKECYLQTCGTIDGEFSFKWKSPISVPEIVDVSMSYKSGADVYLNFTTKNNMDFKCIIRFGGGCGFTNIRLDIL